MPWASLTLTAITLTVIGGLLAVLSLPAAVGAFLLLATVGCCCLLAAAEVLSKAAR